jgi:hypothetical protein
MTATFFLKGLSPEDRLFPQTVESSAKLAKGTLYEAWFDTLQTSPWYQKIVQTVEFPSKEAQATWEMFGDLRKTSFTDWWKATGYQIFSETTSYQPLTVIDSAEPAVNFKLQQSANKPAVLKLEVPLNLSPKALKVQFDEILARYSEYYQEKDDRWDHSTASAHQYRESKLTYQTIKKWLEVYRAYEKQSTKPKFKLYNFAYEMELHPTLFRGLRKNIDVPEDLRIQAANVASDILKSANHLMAHATELKFPCTDPHPWAISEKRKRN